MIRKVIKELSKLKWALTKNGREYIKQQKHEQEGIKSSYSPEQSEDAKEKK